MDAPFAPPPPPPPPPPEGVDLLVRPARPGRGETRRVLTTDEQRAARLAVPYLGPIPSPAHRLDRALVAVSALAIGTRLAAAALLVQRSNLDRDLVRQRRIADQIRLGVPAPSTFATDTRSLAARIHENTGRLHSLSTANLLTLVAVLVLGAVWASHRRPQVTIRIDGETHVESPFPVVVPVWVTKVAMILMVFGIVALVQAHASATTPLDQLAEKRLWSAALQLGFALFWGTRIARVLFSERALTERIAASTLQRSGTVPVAPIPEMPFGYAFGSSHDPGPSGNASGWDEGPPRLGWMLRNAGLAFLAIVFVVMIIGGLTDGGAALLASVAGAALLVGDIVLIRHLNRRADAKARARVAEGRGRSTTPF